jgi:hypothetical protein
MENYQKSRRRTSKIILPVGVWLWAEVLGVYDSTVVCFGLPDFAGVAVRANFCGFERLGTGYVFPYFHN